MQKNSNLYSVIYGDFLAQMNVLKINISVYEFPLALLKPSSS